MDDFVRALAEQAEEARRTTQWLQDLTSSEPSRGLANLLVIAGSFARHAERYERAGHTLLAQFSQLKEAKLLKDSVESLISSQKQSQEDRERLNSLQKQLDAANERARNAEVVENTLKLREQELQSMRQQITPLQTQLQQETQRRRELEQQNSTLMNLESLREALLSITDNNMDVIRRRFDTAQDHRNSIYELIRAQLCGIPLRPPFGDVRQPLDTRGASELESIPEFVHEVVHERPSDSHVPPGEPRSSRSSPSSPSSSSDDGKRESPPIEAREGSVSLGDVPTPGGHISIPETPEQSHGTPTRGSRRAMLMPTGPSLIHPRRQQLKFGGGHHVGGRPLSAGSASQAQREAKRLKLAEEETQLGSENEESFGVQTTEGKGKGLADVSRPFLPSANRPSPVRIIVSTPQRIENSILNPRMKHLFGRIYSNASQRQNNASFNRSVCKQCWSEMDHNRTSAVAWDLQDWACNGCRMHHPEEEQCIIMIGRDAALLKNPKPHDAEDQNEYDGQNAIEESRLDEEARKRRMAGTELASSSQPTHKTSGTIPRSEEAPVTGGSSPGSEEWGRLAPVKIPVGNRLLINNSVLNEHMKNIFHARHTDELANNAGTNAEERTQCMFHYDKSELVLWNDQGWACDGCQMADKPDDQQCIVMKDVTTALLVNPKETDRARQEQFDLNNIMAISREEARNTAAGQYDSPPRAYDDDDERMYDPEMQQQQEGPPGISSSASERTLAQATGAWVTEASTSREREVQQQEGPPGISSSASERRQDEATGPTSPEAGSSRPRDDRRQRQEGLQGRKTPSGLKQQWRAPGVTATPASRREPQGDPRGKTPSRAKQPSQMGFETPEPRVTRTSARKKKEESRKETAPSETGSAHHAEWRALDINIDTHARIDCSALSDKWKKWLKDKPFSEREKNARHNTRDKPALCLYRQVHIKGKAGWEGDLDGPDRTCVRNERQCIILVKENGRILALLKNPSPADFEIQRRCDEQSRAQEAGTEHEGGDDSNT